MYRNRYSMITWLEPSLECPIRRTIELCSDPSFLYYTLVYSIYLSYRCRWDRGGSENITKVFRCSNKDADCTMAS